MTSPELAAEQIRSGIVVGHDGSASADRALVWAVDEARLRGCPVHVVRAWSITHAPRPADVPPGIVPPIDAYEEAVRAELAGDVRAAVGADPGVPVELHPVYARADEALVAASGRAELLVVGSRGRGGVTGLLLGSTSEHVVRHADCAVVVLRG
jgi:nucleotide-binding universal stress UspA family protein